MSATLNPDVAAVPHVRPRGSVVLIVPKRDARTASNASGVYLSVRETDSGIAIPDMVDNDYAEGVVAGYGDGYREGCPTCQPNGYTHVFEVALGDRVLFPPWLATSVMLENVDYQLVEESDIVGIIR